MEKKVKLSHILKPIYFIVFALILEIINFLWLGFKVTGTPNTLQVLPQYFILDLAVFIFIAGVIFLLPRKSANAFFYVFIGFQVLINMVNATLYKIFGDIFSFDMMKLGTEGAAAFKPQFVDFWSILVNLAVLGGIITMQVLLDRKLKKEVTLKKLKPTTLKLIASGLAVVVCISGFWGQTFAFADSTQQKRIYSSDQYLWDNMHFKLESYKRFGTYGFYIKSLANLIYKNDSLTKEEKQELKTSLAAGKKEVNTEATMYGDNLIVIMLESFEWFALDPYNTPTLWKMRTETGVSMESFYAKNKTNVSEDIAILGHMPKDLGMDYLTSKNLLNTPYTLPNLFKSLDLGYKTNFFHSYKKTFYDRDKTNKAMGFDKIYGIEDVSLPNKSTSFNKWNLESAFADKLMDKMIPTDSKFMSFYTTVVTHGSYDTYNPRFEEYYNTYDANLSQFKQWFNEETDYVYPKDKKLEKCFRQYKCAAMDTDKMIGNIIQNLKDKGLDDETTIILYSDHNCYYEDVYFNIKGTDKADYYDIYNYNVPMMIYSPKLTAGANTTFVNTYDIYPTICELYGLPYNTELTQGYNIFSPEIENSTMISYLTGVFNDKFYSLNLIDMYTNQEVTQEDLDTFRINGSKFYEKQRNLELMYKYKLIS